jgi:hypothetical protein
MAVPAVDRTVSVRLERELRDLGSAVRALPLALVHFSLTKALLVVHGTLSLSPYFVPSLTTAWCGEKSLGETKYDLIIMNAWSLAESPILSISKAREVCYSGSMEKRLRFLSLTFGLGALALFGASQSSRAQDVAPSGIAINEETQECGGFSEGDRYFQYSLPEKWQDYYPTPYEGSGRAVIDTPYGRCIVTNPEDCCTYLGFTYAGGNIGIDSLDKYRTNIGPKEKTSTGRLTSILLGLGGLIILAVIIYFPIKMMKQNQDKP